MTPSATYFLPAPDPNAVYTIEAEDVGGATSISQPIVVEDTLPAGLGPYGSGSEAVGFYSPSTGFVRHGGEEENLAGDGLCPTALRCEYPGPLAGHLPALKRGEKLVMQVRAAVPAVGFPLGALKDTARVSGGGAAAAEATAAAAEVNPEPPYRITGFLSALTAGESGAPYTRAGGHPYQFSTEFNFATTTASSRANLGYWANPYVVADRDPYSITSELPPGLIANPQAVPHCPLADFFANTCPISTIVGFVAIVDTTYSEVQRPYTRTAPLFNLQPQGNYPGLLGYNFNGLDFLITSGLRSATDYGVTAASTGVLPITLKRVRVTLWGVPAEHAHDAIRGKECPYGVTYPEEYFESSAEEFAKCALQTGGLSQYEGGPAETPEVPFVTLPTACTGEPLQAGGRSASWQLPAEEVALTVPVTGEYAEAESTVPAVEGCNALRFEPSIEARPTTDLADSPSGLDFLLKVPQNTEGPEGKEGPDGLATADLKEAVVKLPPGLVVNPSSGAGLEGCSPAQVGLTTPVATTPAHFTETPAQCPDASKLGEVEVNTQLLHSPLKGAVYLATPHQNPSGNLLAGYIVLEGEGIIIKLAGQFQTDPQTGQITASFTENPQTPFEEFKFHFFEGARGALRTPAVCGAYTTTATLTPFSAPESGPPVEPAAEFETTAGPTGGACPTAASGEPDKPVFHAGTESPQAGAYSPFSLKLVRQDGEQEIKGIETTLPEGLVGRLAGTSYCPDAALAAAAQKSGAAEQASPSCPAASEVGTVDVASGAGPTPLQVPGKAYLAGPYKGAPLSLAIITPAVAGPFDLGTVVVRTALFVDPLTARITAKSDPIPTILEGIPLDVRSITLQVSRPRFTLNPTSCEPLAITGIAFSSLGASTALDQRFQVGGCSALAFRPSLKISLKGSTKHAGHPALEAAVTYPKGGPYANIAAAQVALPHSEFIDQANLNKTCTRPVLLEGRCPASSVYGHAKAWTPLLEAPLEGPVYLVGGFGYKLPALVAELDGQIRVLLVGKVDSDKEKGIRNTFEAVPDAPVEKFVLQMKGGKKYSLLENSEDLCARPQKAKATFTAQSGKVLELEPTIANGCGSKHKKHRKGHKHGRGHDKRGRPQQRALLGEPGLRLW